MPGCVGGRLLDITIYFSDHLICYLVMFIDGNLLPSGVREGCCVDVFASLFGGAFMWILLLL